MESIKNITQEIKLNPIVENENIKLTLDMYESYLNGGLSEELTEKIDCYISDESEYLLTTYFYHNDLLLLDGDVEVYLTSNLRPQESIFENLKIEIKSEYNLLSYYLNKDIFDYTNLNPDDYDNKKYNTILEVLDFLAYDINSEYLQNNKETITTKDILYCISEREQDKHHKEYIRLCNYIELIDDLKAAYQEQIMQIKEDIGEALQEKYMELLDSTYTDALDNIKTELKNGYDITL